MKTFVLVVVGELVKVDVKVNVEELALQVVHLVQADVLHVLVLVLEDVKKLVKKDVKKLAKQVVVLR